MKKQFLLLFIFFAGYQLTNAQTEDLENLLFDLPNVIFKKIDTQQDHITYELKIKQPIDHSNPSQGFFYQKAYLTHRGLDRPNVIITEGYNRDQNRVYELTDLLQANQLDVEHRFFGESMPQTVDYSYLNLKQATADLHHIRQLFGRIYTEKWISTGISKGGATTIFYRYFYPDDVTVSVPYVAPINNAYEDQRIYQFLDTIGSDDCHKKVRAFQEKILNNREKVIPLLKFYSLGAKANFTYLNLGEAFEYTVLEYPFSFWQYGQDCDLIPGENASIEDMTSYLLGVSDITFFSDQMMKDYASHYYQSATEMGYYGYETKDFEGLLVDLPVNKNPHATFLPGKIKAPFDGQLLKDVNKWLETKAHKMIYIYGAIDTWSATAVRLNKNVDAEWFFMEGKSHANARIANMSDAEKERFIGTLEKWLSIDIENSVPVKN